MDCFEFSTKRSERQLRDIFNMYDDESSGFILAADLRSMLINCGVPREEAASKATVRDRSTSSTSLKKRKLIAIFTRPPLPLKRRKSLPLGDYAKVWTDIQIKLE